MSDGVSESSGKPERETVDPREGGVFTRFFRGAGYLAQGWGFVFSRHPSLLKYCLLPFLINILVFGGVAVGLYFYYGDIVNWIWAKPESWIIRILWYLFYVFIFLLVVLLSYVAFFVIQAILSAPFNDLLSERAELLAYEKDAPPFAIGMFLKGLGKTLVHELAKLSIYLAIIIPLFLLNLVIPVIGPIVFLFFGGYISAIFFAYDFMDFCMARRDWTFGKKWRVLKQNRALTVGFGAAMHGSLLIPVFGLLCIPMAAVGGTLLFCDLEVNGAFEDQSKAPKDPEADERSSSPTDVV
jgi:CysZ protein